MLEYVFAVLEWCKVVISLRNKKPPAFFKEGEVWWCSIGMNVGTEIFGKGSQFTRPVLILKKFGPHSFLGIPITSQSKEGNWYVPITYENRNDRVVLVQARAWDAQRLVKGITTLGSENLREVQRAFSELYSFDDVGQSPENIHPASGAGIGG
jgi:mRNA interferase MazF